MQIAGTLSVPMDDPRPLPRSVKRALGEALSDTPVVCVLGPRQCGKTTLVRTLSPARTYLTLDDPDLLSAALADPGNFVESLPRVVTLDEIQRAPGLLPAIKRRVDEDRRPGQLILTGSANILLLPRVSESLAGRMEIIRLHPLTESEKERRSGGFLQALLDGKLAAKVSKVRGKHAGASTLVDRVVAGGYPEPLGRTRARAARWYAQYIAAILERDVRDIATIRGSGELRRLLEMCAIRTGTLLNVSSLATDLGIARATLDGYLAVLERMYLIRRLPAWHTNASRRLMKTAKIHIVDTGLGAALAGLSKDDFTASRERFGPLLETWVVAQIEAQSAWSNPSLRCSHFRNKDQLEVDLVLTQGARVWGIEVKAGKSVQAADCRSLEHLASLVGKNFKGGFVLYDGVDCLSMGNGILAVPLSWLWEM